MQGYCVRCKQKQDMLAATRTHMKNGRRAMIGTCACCATPIYVAGYWEEDTPGTREMHTLYLSQPKPNEASS